jgi:hypothetical protein
MEAALLRSTTSASVVRALSLLLLGLLTACGTKQVVVQGAFPPPVMERMPLRIGVFYDEAFRNHEFYDEAKGRNETSWIVKTGAAQMDMYNTLLPGMFAQVVQLQELPSPTQPAPVDAILVPKVDELQYAIPTQTKIKVYEIWMRYAY